MYKRKAFTKWLCNFVNLRALLELDENLHISLGVACSSEGIAVEFMARRRWVKLWVR
jgi:hypothetical protein